MRHIFVNNDAFYRIENTNYYLHTRRYLPTESCVIVEFQCHDLIGFESNYMLMNCYVQPVSSGSNVNILCEFLKDTKVFFRL